MERRKVFMNKNKKSIQPGVFMTAAAVLVVSSVAGCAGWTNMRGNTQYGADQRMAKEAQAALERDSLYKFPNVDVYCFRGQVQLGGVINHEAQREAAIRDASTVPGILGVKDNMMLNTNPPVAPVQ